MKILVIDEAFPHPLDTGKRIRSFNLCSRLALKHTVHYLAYGTEDSAAARAMVRAKIHPIAIQRQTPAKTGLLFYLRLLGNLASANPYIVTSHYTQEFEQALHKSVDEIRPDIIVCEWTPYAAYVKNMAGPLKLIVAHNIEYRIWQRYLENERNPLKKWYIRKQTEKLVRFEKDAFHWVDGTIAVSADEGQEISEINPLLSVEVVENGVDLEYFRSGKQEDERLQLAFVGAMNWRPNQDAAVYFAEEIFPLIRKQVPEASAVFVGGAPPTQVKRLGDIAGITVTGRVDDVRPYVHQSAMVIVPLRIGGGTRLKILEAMAMGKAVVSTSIGAEGLEVTDGVNIMLADTPSDFADRVKQLSLNKPLRKQLGEAGRKLVEESYGWDLLAEKQASFMEDLVSGQ